MRTSRSITALFALLASELVFLNACGETGSKRAGTDSASAFPVPDENGVLKLITMEGITIVGHLTKATNFSGNAVLLLHQKSGNLHEYDTVVPRITAAGFDVLALDLRGGATRWGYDNETAKINGELDATKTATVANDIRAGLTWLSTAQYEKTIITGSSYSAALALLVVGKSKITQGIACFSPGEYVPGQSITDAAASVKVPFFMTQGPADKGLEEIFKEIPTGANIVRYFPKFGVHGAASMRQDENPKSYADLTEEYIKFIVMVAAGVISSK